MKNVTVSKSENGNILIKSGGFEYHDNILSLENIDGESIKFKSEMNNSYKTDESYNNLLYVLSDEELETINNYLKTFKLNNVEFAIFGKTIFCLKIYSERKCRNVDIVTYKLSKGLSKYDFPNNNNDYTKYIIENMVYNLSSIPHIMGEYIVFKKHDIIDNEEDYSVTMDMLFGKIFKNTKLILSDNDHDCIVKKNECNQYTTDVLESLPQLIPGCTFTLFYYDTINDCTQTISYSYRSLFSFIHNQLDNVIDEYNGIKNIKITIH